MKTYLLRNCFCYLLTFTFLIPLHADDLEKALKALKSKEYITAKTYLDKILVSSPLHTGANYGLAVYYSLPDNPLCNPFKAYDYSILSEKYYATLTEREKPYLEKLGITPAELEKIKQTAGQDALEKATVLNTMAAYDQVISKFSALPDIVSKASDQRNTLAFEEAKTIDTYQSYQRFLVKYPHAKQIPEAKERYELLLYETITSPRTIQAYEKFYKNYPESPYRLKAKENYEKLLYENVINRNAVEAYQAFINEHPDSPYATKARNKIESLIVRLPIRENGRWGFINGTGKKVIPSDYEKVGLFSEGYAKFKKNGLWGFLDDKGHEIIKPIYHSASDFSDGLVVVTSRNKGRSSFSAFYINNNGNRPFDRVYETNGSYMPIHSFKEGLAAIEDPKSKKLGFIDKLGRFAIAPLFSPYYHPKGENAEYPFSFFSEGYAWVKEASVAGLIDKKGIFLMKGNYNQPVTDSLSPTLTYKKSFSEGLCLVEEAPYGTRFYIDASGKKVVNLPVGFVARNFSDGVAWTRSAYEKKFYLIDKEGKTVFSIEGTYASDFHEGLAVIRKETPANRAYFYDETPKGTYSYIDKTGKPAFDFTFDIVYDPAFPLINGEFKNGVACILLEGKQTYINRKGEIIWQSPEYW